MKKIIFITLTLAFIAFLSCTKEKDTVITQTIVKDTIKVDFGYSVVYSAKDSLNVSVVTSDASTNIPTNSTITWFIGCPLMMLQNVSSQSQTGGSANWSLYISPSGSYDMFSGKVSITERVTIGSEVYSAVHSFTITK